METIDLLTLIGGLAVSVISYFLRQTMADLRATKEIAYDTRSKLSILENDYINKIEQLNGKFDMLNESIKELTKEIKNINKK